MPSITVVGSINRDIVAYVDRHPAPGETVLGLRSAMFPGGKGANQAVAAARLRSTATHPVRMIGRIGADAFGRDMRDVLAADGIDVAGVTVADQPTGIALITVDAKAENAITVVSGANHDWPQSPVAANVGAGDIVVCQLEIPLQVVADVFVAARAHGATTILNPAPFQALPAALLQATDLVVLNEIELGQLIGASTGDLADNALIAAACHLQQQGPNAVILTLGHAGVLVVDRTGRTERIPGQTVRAIDTTGAGDCFVGALAAALMDSADVLAAAHFANRAAALSVTREGAAASIPHRHEVDALA